MSLLDANMYVSSNCLDFRRSSKVFKSDRDSQDSFSNVQLRSYHYESYDSSRQYLLSGLLEIDHMGTFQFTAGQREVLGA